MVKLVSFLLVIMIVKLQLQRILLLMIVQAINTQKVAKELLGLMKQTAEMVEMAAKAVLV